MLTPFCRQKTGVNQDIRIFFHLFDSNRQLRESCQVKEPLKNVSEAASSRQKPVKTKFIRNHEYFALTFNVEMTTQLVLRRLLKQMHIKVAILFPNYSTNTIFCRLNPQYFECHAASTKFNSSANQLF
ncbi:hypothetical protein ABO04_02515 [Nitrosomonas sp. HPC101]|nr:hypothetical protein [Nitrosomonas sp. HPC101]